MNRETLWPAVLQLFGHKATHCCPVGPKLGIQMMPFQPHGVAGRQSLIEHAAVELFLQPQHALYPVECCNRKKTDQKKASLCTNWVFHYEGGGHYVYVCCMHV